MSLGSFQPAPISGAYPQTVAVAEALLQQQIRVSDNGPASVRCGGD